MPLSEGGAEDGPGSSASDGEQHFGPADLELGRKRPAIGGSPDTRTLADGWAGSVRQNDAIQRGHAATTGPTEEHLAVV